MNTAEQDKAGYVGVYQYVHSFPDASDLIRPRLNKPAIKPAIVIAHSPDSFFEAARQLFAEVTELEHQTNKK